jgi:hypothetical protein
MAISDKEREKLFRQFKYSVGAPIRQIELTDEMLETYLVMAIETYTQYVQEFLIEHQWQSVYGQNIDTTDMSFALSVRDFDYVTKQTFAYSKQVGLQNDGPWELKKDFIELEAGRQVYTIPAGRELNEVLWITPPTTDAALFANYGGFDSGYGGGFAQMGVGFNGNGSSGGRGGGYYIAPAFDVLLTAQDFNLKNRMLRGELAYKVTAGPNGTRLLHLMSTPGSKLSFTASASANSAGSRVSPTAIGLQGCHVWYHYYDTGVNQEDIDECRKLNPDVMILPNEVPLYDLDYNSFNQPTKILIRDLFIAMAKISLGRVRGKFGGIVGVAGAERTMDFQSLLDEGTKEKEDLLKRLDERLVRLGTPEQLKRAAEEAENINKALRYRPMRFMIR